MHHNGNSLYPAAQSGDLETVSRLLDSGVSVNFRANWDDTALMAASRGGHLSTVRLLLDRGANPLLVSAGDHQSDALLDAIRSRHPKVVRVLAEHPKLASRLDAALCFSVDADYSECIDVLLDCGANPNAIDCRDGRAALMKAVALRHYNLIEMLLKRGADVNAFNSSGSCTPLMLAVLIQDADIIESLLRAGADINLTDHEGRTALDMAKQSNNIQIMNILSPGEP
jgi:ankyrin repeat protein